MALLARYSSLLLIAASLVFSTASTERNSYTQIVGDGFSLENPEYLRMVLGELAQKMKTKRSGLQYMGSRGKKSEGVQKKLEFIGSRGKKSNIPFDEQELVGPAWFSAIPTRYRKALEDLNFSEQKRGLEFMGSRGRRNSKRGLEFIGSRG